VLLGAEQHDIGMAAWDLSPSRNPDTGLPHSFTQMPLGAHLELWTEGPRRLLRQSRYAALLAAMHGRRLYDGRDLAQMQPAQADAIREFVARQRRFEAQLLAALRTDPSTAPAVAGEVLARNSQLVWTWDFLSLALCLDWAPTVAREVPTSDGPVDLELERRSSGAHTLDPWPFAESSVSVRCEGQLLTGAFDTDEQLHEALSVAPWVTLQFELRPAGRR
jgi:hypothetical protein